MSTDAAPSIPPDLSPLIPHREFAVPELPRDEALKRSWRRFRHLLRRDDDLPLIADDRLQRTTVEVLDAQRTAPVCRPVLDELEATLGVWSRDPAPSRWLQLVVLPPGDDNQLPVQWAREQGHTVVTPPTREALMSESGDAVFDLDGGDGVLIVPQLSAWVLRHRRGLGAVRELLVRLGNLTRHCVVVCDSWSWTWLCKAVEAHLYLPEPQTFAPFDEARLRHWFAEIARQDSLSGFRFRLTRDGSDILAVDDQGRPESDYLERLAAYSRGIPWVAWHIWHASLRTRVEQDDSETAAALEADEQTLWVGALEEFSLPGGDDTDALLILHALLLHGALDRQTLDLVLPAAPSGMLQALESAGFTLREGGVYRCAPGAYPAIRQGLGTAGVPLDGC